jgi:hypothetical protein
LPAEECHGNAHFSNEPGSFIEALETASDLKDLVDQAVAAAQAAPQQAHCSHVAASAEAALRTVQANPPPSQCLKSRTGRRSESKSQHCLAGHEHALQMKVVER